MENRSVRTVALFALFFLIASAIPVTADSTTTTTSTTLTTTTSTSTTTTTTTSTTTTSATTTTTEATTTSEQTTTTLENTTQTTLESNETTTTLAGNETTTTITNETITTTTLPENTTTTTSSPELSTTTTVTSSSIETTTTEEERFCADNTPVFTCTPIAPFYCNQNAKLVENASYCGCPRGTVLQGGLCLIPPQCNDGTKVSYCSITKPLYCGGQSALIENCSFCGCGNGLECSPENKCAKPSVDLKIIVKDFDGKVIPSETVQEGEDVVRVKLSNGTVSGIVFTGVADAARKPIKPNETTTTEPSPVTTTQAQTTTTEATTTPEATTTLPSTTTSEANNTETTTTIQENETTTSTIPPTTTTQGNGSRNFSGFETLEFAGNDTTTSFLTTTTQDNTTTFPNLTTTSSTTITNITTTIPNSTTLPNVTTTQETTLPTTTLPSTLPPITEQKQIVLTVDFVPSAILSSLPLLSAKTFGQVTALNISEASAYFKQATVVPQGADAYCSDWNFQRRKCKKWDSVNESNYDIDFNQQVAFASLNTLLPEYAYCGNIYSSIKLDKNILSNGTCFQVMADDVEIDCDGHSITGNGKGKAVYAQLKSGLAVKNCVIKGFNWGIIEDGQVHGTVYSNVVVSNNTFTNIREVSVGLAAWTSNFLISNNFINGSRDGIKINAVSGYDIASNVSYNYITGTQFAISTYGLSGIVVQGNYVQGNAAGIRMHSTKSSRVENNTFIDTNDGGVFVETGDSDFINITSNYFKGKGVGIRKHALAKDNISNNTLEGEREETQWSPPEEPQ